MNMLASHICTVQDGARSLEFAIKLLQLVLNEPPLDRINPENIAGLSHIVGAIARQFAVLHNAFKFDALHLLTILMSSKNTLLHNALRSMANENWTSHVRLGITTVLQNRVVPSEKLQGLLLVESMMSILGEGWLVEQTQFDDNQIQMQADKCMLLVLETGRVQVAVLLNELAYSKYEASKSPASLLKQHEPNAISHAADKAGSPNLKDAFGSINRPNHHGCTYVVPASHVDSSTSSSNSANVKINSNSDNVQASGSGLDSSYRCA